MAKKGFDYELEDKVVFNDAIEVTGTVIGRAEYVNGDPKYLIRYMDGTGSPTEAWWDQDAISEDENAGSSRDDD